MHIEELSKDSILVTMNSPFTGQPNSMTIPMGYDEFMAAYDKWQAGEYIQNAFKRLSAELREFIKTGISPEEWDETFGGDDSEDEPTENERLRN